MNDYVNIKHMLELIGTEVANWNTSPGSSALLSQVKLDLRKLLAEIWLAEQQDGESEDGTEAGVSVDARPIPVQDVKFYINGEQVGAGYSTGEPEKPEMVDVSDLWPGDTIHLSVIADAQNRDGTAVIYFKAAEDLTVDLGQDEIGRPVLRALPAIPADDNIKVDVDGCCDDEVCGDCGGKVDSVPITNDEWEIFDSIHKTMPISRRGGLTFHSDAMGQRYGRVEFYINKQNDCGCSGDACRGVQTPVWTDAMGKQYFSWDEVGFEHLINIVRMLQARDGDIFRNQYMKAFNAGNTVRMVDLFHLHEEMRRQIIDAESSLHRRSMTLRTYYPSYDPTPQWGNGENWSPGEIHIERSADE